MILSDSAVYTTIAPERLEAAQRGDAPSEVLMETKRWVRARELFEAAQEAGEIFPVLFSDSRACARLLFWARVGAMEVTAEGTEFAFSHLTPLRRRTTQDLVLLTTGLNIAPGFIRPYALVNTPGFIDVAKPAPPRIHVKVPIQRKTLAPPPDPAPPKALAAKASTSSRAAPQAGGAPLTLFSWGYKGWGNALPQLFDVTNAAEKSRGYSPPVFADVRFSLAVRAEGFRGSAFKNALPEGRYRHFKGLGNAEISSRGLRIHDPASAADLLDWALEEQANGRRVIFFCSCATPSRCHRNEVRSLVLNEARRRRLKVDVQEWPGGEPSVRPALALSLEPDVFSKLVGGGPRIPVTEAFALKKCASLPWGSLVQVSDGQRRTTVAVGPAQFSNGGWFLPVFLLPVEENDGVEVLLEPLQQRRTEDHYGLFTTAK